MGRSERISISFVYEIARQQFRMSSAFPGMAPGLAAVSSSEGSAGADKMFGNSEGSVYQLVLWRGVLHDTDAEVAEFSDHNAGIFEERTSTSLSSHEREDHFVCSMCSRWLIAVRVLITSAQLARATAAS